MMAFCMVCPVGFEPTTSRLSGDYSNLLSYGHSFMERSEGIRTPNLLLTKPLF